VAVNDWSFNLISEISCSPITNLELRLRGIIPITGARPNTAKSKTTGAEFRLRYFC